MRKYETVAKRAVNKRETREAAFFSAIMSRFVDSHSEFWGSASGQSQDRNTTHHGIKSGLPKD